MLYKLENMNSRRSLGSCHGKVLLEELATTRQHCGGDLLT